MVSMFLTISGDKQKKLLQWRLVYVFGQIMFATKSKCVENPRTRWTM